jgi:hypothetical protein
MSDWETVGTMVTEKNIRDFADVGSIEDHEDPATNIKMIEAELANPKIHPVAKKALEEEHARMTAKLGTTPTEPQWETVGKAPKEEDVTWETVGKAKPSDDGITVGGDALGTLEMAGNFVSGIPAALGGGLAYLGGLAGTGGDTEAAMATKQGTEQRINDAIQYNPRTKSGKMQSEGLSRAMNAVVDAGGKTMPQMLASIPLVGEDFTKWDKESPGAQEAIGRAFTEMGMNVAPIPGFKGARGEKAKVSAALEAAAKLEALAGKGEVPAPHDLGPAKDRGVPGTAENPQGELFSPQVPEPTPTKPIPDNAQMDMFGNPHEGNTMPYEVGVGGVGDATGVPKSPADALNVPYTADHLELVPKDTVAPMQQFKNPNVGIDKPIGTRDTAKAKLREAAATEAAIMAKEASKKAEIEAAYLDLDRQKQGDYGRMEGQKELSFAESVRNIEDGRSAARAAFLDRSNLDFKHLEENVGDKSLMSREQTYPMTEALHKGDINGALKQISDNHPNGSYRKLASYLADKMQGITLDVHPDGIIQMGERRVTGFYDPATSKVTLSGLGATSPHTVLHELVHAVTSHMIDIKPNDIRVMALKDLYNKVKGIEEKFPGVVNVKEFVAEAFSNPKFQEFLKAQKMDNRSMWTRFVDGIKSMLGIKTGDVANALDHALDLGKQVIEAYDGPTRAHIKGIFKEAGMSNKLADLMAQKPEDVRAVTKREEGVKEAVYKIPGLTDPISDFKFYDKPVGEIVEMARTGQDIPKNAVETFSQQMQAGGLFESLKTRNPVVKYTYERLTRAFQEAAENTKKFLTNEQDGLKEYMRRLSGDEKGEIHNAMMLHEGQRELTSMELAEAGMNEKQIAYYNKYRELSKQFFHELNQRRVDLGLKPMDARVAHMAGRFMGDFSRMVYRWDEGGVKKVVGRISGTTSRELAKAYKHMQEAHPEWEFGNAEYSHIGKGRDAADRFGGLMEALNFLADTNTDTAALLDSYRDFIQKDAVNYLNATRHAKAKVKDAGGIIGSEGNKPWEDAKKNAEEGMKAQLSYFEQGYAWMAMEKAVGDLKPLLGDEGVAKQMPNAVEWANKYKDHAMRRNQGAVADAANTILSSVGEATGLGHSNLLKVSNVVKHRMMQKFMGLFNIPFTVTQLMQPLQTQPAMIALLHSRGLEFSTAKAQLAATETYLGALLHHMGKVGDGPQGFDKMAMDYADKMGVFDVKMADHTRDINGGQFGEMFDKLADVNIKAPEHLTRGMSFLFFSHLLKDAGVPVKDIFGAAENMTNLTMVNYHPLERPMGYAKLGWVGDVASALTRYKHNQWSQMAFYAREGIRGEQGHLKATAPLATFLATSLAFGGIMGFFAYQEADAAYQLFTEHALKKPDSLSNQLFKQNISPLLSHGLFSTLGIDMTTRFSNANVLPDTKMGALIPYGSAVMDMAQATGNFLLDPTSTSKGKQMAKSWAPQSVQGLMENSMFTNKTKDGKNLYVNPTEGPKFGEGRTYRSDAEMTGRNLGFRSVRESKELQKIYSDGQIDQANKRVVEGIHGQIKHDIMDGKLTKDSLRQQALKAIDLGQTPDDFIKEFTKNRIAMTHSQEEMKLYQYATGGLRAALKMRARK